jgi:hypothetical protein
MDIPTTAAANPINSRICTHQISFEGLSATTASWGLFRNSEFSFARAGCQPIYLLLPRSRTCYRLSRERAWPRTECLPGISKWLMLFAAASRRPECRTA